MRVNSKRFIYGVLSFFVITIASFVFFQKPFLSFEAVKYTDITIPLNAIILIVSAIAVGNWIAKRPKSKAQAKVTAEKNVSLNWAGLGQFIWRHYGLGLTVALVLWGIYILHPEWNWNLSFWIYPDTAYAAPVWKQFIIYQVISFESVTAWLLGYLTYVIQRSKREYDCSTEN